MIIDYKRHIDVNKVAQVQDSSLRVYSCLWVRRFTQMAIITIKLLLRVTRITEMTANIYRNNT